MIVKSYQYCKRCPLWKTRKRIVFGRGVLPCDVLLIGDNPNDTEDKLGSIMEGPVGRMFRQLWDDASKLAGFTPTYYITNTIACRPCDSKTRANRAPLKEEIFACAERLSIEINAAQAKQTIFLGKLAYTHARKLCPGGVLLVHPSYVLRSGGTAAPIYKTTVRDIAEVFKQCQA